MPHAAVIGHNWGLRAHAATLRRAGWDIDIVVGRDSARTAAAAEEWHIPRHSVDPKHALDSDVDLVVIAVPWDKHHDLTVRALQSDKALLIEHPLSHTLPGADAIARIAAARSVPTFVNFPTRFIPVVHDLRRELAQRDLQGDVHVRHEFRYPTTEEPDWLPLLLTHSMELADHLFRIGQAHVERVKGICERPLSECPSWSWPLGCSAGADGGSYVACDAIDIRATCSVGTYDLSVGYGSELDFVETLTLQSRSGQLGYETRLSRDDETSPWRMSPLTYARSREPLRCVASEVGAGRDVWLDAHLAQLNAVQAILRGERPPVLPADAIHASRIHSCVATSLQTSLSPTRRP